MIQSEFLKNFPLVLMSPDILNAARVKELKLKIFFFHKGLNEF